MAGKYRWDLVWTSDLWKFISSWGNRQDENLKQRTHVELTICKQGGDERVKMHALIDSVKWADVDTRGERSTRSRRKKGILFEGIVMFMEPVKKYELLLMGMGNGPFPIRGFVDIFKNRGGWIEEIPVEAEERVSLSLNLVSSLSDNIGRILKGCDQKMNPYDWSVTRAILRDRLKDLREVVEGEDLTEDLDEPEEERIFFKAGDPSWINETGLTQAILEVFGCEKERAIELMRQAQVRLRRENRRTTEIGGVTHYDTSFCERVLREIKKIRAEDPEGTVQLSRRQAIGLSDLMKGIKERVESLVEDEVIVQEYADLILVSLGEEEESLNQVLRSEN